MGKLTKRERNLITIFVLLLLIVIALEWVMFPSMEKINGLKKQREDLQRQWEEIEAYLGTEEALAERSTHLSEKISELGKKLPTNQSSHLYWEYIQTSAEKHGVKIIRMQEDSVEGGANKRLIHFQANGKQGETIDFITHLQNMPYVHAINEMSIQRQDEGIIANMSLYISHFPEDLEG